MQQLKYTQLHLPAFSDHAIRVMREGNIIGPTESPTDMVIRVLKAVFAIESQFNTPAGVVEKLRTEFSALMADKVVTLGSPTLTNAGRHLEMPLSSCVAVPIDLTREFDKIKPVIEDYYHHNMGSGFNFSEVENPVKILLQLHEHAAEETRLAKHDRYIGNMGNLDVDHPRILEFVRLKQRIKGLRHFNLSVNVNTAFMDAVTVGLPFTDKNGQPMDARAIWDAMCESAWDCGDPGILFLDRINRDNPTPLLGSYGTTAPCAEVGLAKGESCVFGYINTGRLVTTNAYGVKEMDFPKLERVTALLTRVLDNTLEVSLGKYSMPESKHIMSAKRKIGIGLCGFAELLIGLDIPYDSPEATTLLQNILITISYHSKIASMELARDRGSFSHLFLSRYMETPGFLAQKYGHLEGLRVSPADWQQLDEAIRCTGLLRNAQTSALPPSGRSALIVDASNSIEPLFSLNGPNGELNPFVRTYLDEVDARRIHQLKQVLVKATEISPAAHLEMVAKAIACIDEGASKTINLNQDARQQDIHDIFMQAWNKGLKAISIYRDQTISGQPQQINVQ